MTDVEQAFQLVVDFLRRKGFVALATKLENSERTKIGKLSDAPTRLEDLLLKGHAFEQGNSQMENNDNDLEETDRSGHLKSVTEDAEIPAIKTTFADKKVKSKAKQMGLSKSVNQTFFKDPGNFSSSVPRTDAPIVSMVARVDSNKIGLSSRLAYRHSREPHTPLRTINKERRATSATVPRALEPQNQTMTDDGDEYSDDEDIGFVLSDSQKENTGPVDNTGPITRGNLEIYQKITKSSESSSKESEDSDDDIDPKASSNNNQIFSMDLEEDPKPEPKPTKKLSVSITGARTKVTTIKNTGLQKDVAQKAQHEKTQQEKETLSREISKKARRKKVSKEPVELDFSECNILSNPTDAKLEYFNLKIIHQERHTGFEESRDFPIKLHDIVAGRYEITGYIGSAAFSRAVHCFDHKTSTKACMKIIKNNKDFFDQCLDELKLLKYIKVNGDPNKHHVLEMYDYFYFKEHLFIVCELLLDNLYEFYKKNMQNADEPTYFTLSRVQKVTQQCLIALQYIHSLGIIHCDLKPENILMKDVEICEIKVIDFGSSCYTTDVLSTYVQSRSYRAPEVILGLSYGQKIDLWSLGCILAELLTGRVVFQNYSVVTLLARIIGIIGPIPEHMMQTGAFVTKYFTEEGELYENTEIITPKKTTLQRRVKTDDQLFLDFLRQLLTIDPAKRLSASEALQHPWLKKVYAE